MSTRGHIAIKENGKYRYIYNQNDSYIDGLGIVLYHYYRDVKKIRALIDLGNTDSIYKFINNTASSHNEHINRHREKRGTVARYRESQRWSDYCNYDISWEECVAVETENLNEVLGEEFTYVFDVEENKWYIAYWNDKYQVRDLETVLHSKELLEKLFSEMYKEEYMPKFYEKCLSA